LFYYEVLEGLHRRKIRYLIVGGLAVNLHGVPRTTQDIDLIISLERNNVADFCSLMKELDYAPRLPVDPAGMADDKILSTWINEKNMKAFSFYNLKKNYKTIDIVLNSGIMFEDAFNRKKITKMKDFEIFFTDIDDLIEMKKFAGRSKDIADAEMLGIVKKITGNSDGK
jgi:hypothetical protein